MINLVTSIEGTRQKLVFVFFLCLAFFLLVVNVAFAQTASSSASPSDPGKKYGLTYPVAELGGCKDYASCRSFCQDPVHKDACISFAKTKGFYLEDAAAVKAKSLLDAAKVELG